MPSTVRIFCPSQLAASMVQAYIGTPSTCTVHAPQEESSQPRLLPVRLRFWRRESSNNLLGSQANSCGRPLTSRVSRTFFIDTLREGGQVSAARNLRRFLASILAQAGR